MIYVNSHWHHYKNYQQLRNKWRILRTETIIDYTPPQSLTNIQPLDIIRITDNYYEVSTPVIPSITPTLTSIPTTWKDYVKSLSAWEQQILAEVTKDITTFWTHFTPRDQEWIATSDGSFKHNTGAYAWLIHDGQRTIITGTGPVTGNPVTPFLTEYHGFIAIYCCMYHVCLYHDITTKVTICPYVDNTKLIRYQAQITHRPQHQAHIDDYDLHQIHQKYTDILQQRGVTILQATKITKTTATTTGQSIPHDLHQQMDSIARKSRQLGGYRKHKPIPIPRVHLRDMEGEITSQEKQIINTNWNTYLIEEYYATRWRIPAAQLQMYDWHIYGKLYEQANPTIQKYMVKMLTGWLPVYHQTNKMTTNKKNCPLCQNNETLSHLFQCQHRSDWRNDLQTKLTAKLASLRTPLELHQEIDEHIKNILHQKTEYQHFKHFTPFAGLLPRRWRQQCEQMENSDTANTWARNLGKWMTQQGMALWTTRNKQFNENGTKQSTTHRRLDEKIEHLYTLQHDVNIHDKNIFNTPIEERFEMPEHQKQQWIEETSKTIHLCIADHHKKMNTGQKDIRNFFRKPEKSQ